MGEKPKLLIGLLLVMVLVVSGCISELKSNELRFCNEHGYDDFDIEKIQSGGFLSSGTWRYYCYKVDNGTIIEKVELKMTERGMVIDVK